MMISKSKNGVISRRLRLSKQLLDQADLSVGDEVEIVVGERLILLKKAVKSKPKYDIRELVARIPKGYKAEQASFGMAVGKEEW